MRGLFFLQIKKVYVTVKQESDIKRPFGFFVEKGRAVMLARFSYFVAYSLNL